MSRGARGGQRRSKPRPDPSIIVAGNSKRNQVAVASIEGPKEPFLKLLFLLRPTWNARFGWPRRRHLTSSCPFGRNLRLSAQLPLWLLLLVLKLASSRFQQANLSYRFDNINYQAFEVEQTFALRLWRKSKAEAEGKAREAMRATKTRQFVRMMNLFWAQFEGTKDH